MYRLKFNLQRRLTELDNYMSEILNLHKHE